MLHCGWRGLAAGIVARGAEAVGATAAAIGPGIGPCCYEVGARSSTSSRSLAGSLTGRMLRPARRSRRRLLVAAGVDTHRVGRPLHELRAELFFSHRRDAGRPAARPGSSGSRPDGRADPRHRPGPGRGEPRAGPRRDRGGVEILVAAKYVPLEEMGALAEAGVALVGENRLQELEAKRERWGDAFEWDFIGNLQSRKVKPAAAALPADPLGRHRIRPSSSSAATAAPTPRSWSRSTSPARRARAASPRPSCGLSSSAARSGSAA